jgi:hypothetical protein
MKKHLHYSGKKVDKANDKMAEKLSRIIRESEASKSEATKNIIVEIMKSLIEISNTKQRPDVSFSLETSFEISVPFERKITFEQSEELTYNTRPTMADEDISHSQHLGKLFSQFNIDKDLLRKRVKNVLNNKSQTTLQEVIDHHGGIEKGLAELFGYIGIAKEFKHSISTERTQKITFDTDRNKSIQIPEIILTQ